MQSARARADTHVCICECVRVRTGLCARKYAFVRARACVPVCERACVRACVLALNAPVACLPSKRP
eukprot:59479-Pleurochrysis_carterae.AAC.1